MAGGSGGGREGADACGHCGLRADVGINLNGRAEERGHVSPFRGRPNIKLICSMTSEQLSLTLGH